MKLKVLSVRKAKEKDLQELGNDFINRINHDTKLDLVMIKDSNKNSEGLKLMNHLSKNPGYHIVLSDEGEPFTSQGLALLLKSRNEPITFVIGGPDGLSPVVKEKANMILSLSSITLTHEMAKVLLLEQIYRSISITNNRKYYRV